MCSERSAKARTSVPVHAVSRIASRLLRLAQNLTSVICMRKAAWDAKSLMIRCQHQRNRDLERLVLCAAGNGRLAANGAACERR